MTAASLCQIAVIIVMRVILAYCIITFIIGMCSEFDDKLSLSEIPISRSSPFDLTASLAVAERHHPESL